MFSHLTHLACTACGETVPADGPHNLCPACGKVLEARYDLAAAAATMTRAELAHRPFDLWRYHEVLPVRDPTHVITLGEGGTPLLPLTRYGASIGLPNLRVKDEGRNPTASFKARGLCVAVSRAKELGLTGIVMPSAGNAASALCAYAARAGITAHVFMPRDTPQTMQAECIVYGAEVTLVNGLLHDAGVLARRAGQEHGWFDVSTLREPYRVEGKKTMGYEIVEQLDWRVPDIIFYPTGGGTGIIGMWKAFAEMEAMGLIGPRRPRMVVVQAEGCQPIARAFANGWDHAPLWENAQTRAPGLRAPVTIGDYLILAVLRASGGTCVTVSDAEMVETMAEVSRVEGFYSSPEGAATCVAARRLRAIGWLQGDESVVVFATAAGIKQTELVERRELPILDPIPAGS
jgi:threonine synthase